MQGAAATKWNTLHEPVKTYADSPYVGPARIGEEKSVVTH